jgi:hypothetical protein
VALLSFFVFSGGVETNKHAETREQKGQYDGFICSCLDTGAAKDAKFSRTIPLGVRTKPICVAWLFCLVGWDSSSWAFIRRRCCKCMRTGICGAGVRREHGDQQIGVEAERQ